MSLIDSRDITSVNKELQQLKDELLTQAMTWTSVTTKTIASDGSMTDQINSDTTIKGLIESIRGGGAANKYLRLPQGVAENSTHVLWTLSNYNIVQHDQITYNGKIYRVEYVVPKQFNIDYLEVLLKVDN